MKDSLVFEEIVFFFFFNFFLIFFCIVVSIYEELGIEKKNICMLCVHSD